MDFNIKYDSGKRFIAERGGFTVVAGKGDPGAGGEDGMSPAELFACSVGMCVGGYVVGYLQRHDLKSVGLTIGVDREEAKAPNRTTRLKVKINLPGEVGEEDREKILKIADHCYIHQSIRGGMQVDCSL